MGNKRAWRADEETGKEGSIGIVGLGRPVN